MKKKLLMLALIACMGFSVAACGDEKKEQETSEENNTNEAKNEQTTFEILSELNIEDYVTLGEYKGIALEKTVTTVTEKAIEDEIAYALSTYPVEVTDRSDVRDGDVVNIDFTGAIDGEEFEGGSNEDFDLTIGSNSFIEGFESGLIGATVGETRVLDLAFPDDYWKTDYAGKNVEFTVTINSISICLEEPTDEWVAANVEGYYTVDEYREAVRGLLEDSYEQSAHEQLVYNAWSAVIETCTIHDYPEILVERGVELYKADVQSYAEYNSMELEEYVEYCGATMEEYEEYALEYGQSIASQAIVNYAICMAEGYAIGDEGYQAELETILENYACTEEELISSYGRDDVEQTVLLNRVCNMIIDEAVITEVESSESAE